MNIVIYVHRCQVSSSISVPRNIVQLYSSVLRNIIKPKNVSCFSVVLLKVRHIDFQQYYISKVMISSLFSP
jgi:hypothetical protein